MKPEDIRELEKEIAMKFEELADLYKRVLELDEIRMAQMMRDALAFEEAVRFEGAGDPPCEWSGICDAGLGQDPDNCEVDTEECWRCLFHNMVRDSHGIMAQEPPALVSEDQYVKRGGILNDPV